MISSEQIRGELKALLNRFRELDMQIGNIMSQNTGDNKSEQRARRHQRILDALGEQIKLMERYQELSKQHLLAARAK